MKIIGLMLTWNNLEFFRCAVKQALDFCDELILVEGCHSIQYPQRSDDGTVEFAKSLIGHPKLRIVDFTRGGRYDRTQRAIRYSYPRQSSYYRPGNWVFHWDDDIFFFDDDLRKIRQAMENADRDSLSIDTRHFFYNFRFNIRQNDTGWAFRIKEGAYLKGVSAHYYKDGRPYDHFQLEDSITAFHYGYVKRPERMRARWALSVEKGTEASVNRFEKWMSVSWEKDEDIQKSDDTLANIFAGGKLNVYNGKHPEVLDEHPWRYINDVRRL